MNTVQEDSHITINKPYTLVFLLLAFFTIVEVNIGFLGDIIGDQANIQGMVSIALIVLSLAKAYLVAAYFMGIKYQSRPWVTTAIVFGVPLFIALPVVLIPALGTVLYLCGY